MWKSCERLGILPPGVSASWDANSVWKQAELIAYNQVRDWEISDAEDQYNKFLANIHGAK